MQWTAIDKQGYFVKVVDNVVNFNNQMTLRADAVYTPVVASDRPDSEHAIMLYRHHHRNSVHVLTTLGDERELAAVTEGKWPLGIVRIGLGRFLAAWLNKGVSSVTLVEITLQPFTVSPPRIVPCEPGMVLLGLRADGSFRMDNTDGGFNAIDIGQRRLFYWTNYGDLFVGVDGELGAPNRVLLTDSIRWYVVADNVKSAFFPPTMSIDGTVANFEGELRTLEEIKLHPLTESSPTIPLPPPLDVSMADSLPPLQPVDVVLGPPPPIDCKLSEWGEWTKQRRYGVQARTRTVLVEPAYGGRPCDRLREERIDPTLPKWQQKLLSWWHGVDL